MERPVHRLPRAGKRRTLVVTSGRLRRVDVEWDTESDDMRAPEENQDKWSKEDPLSPYRESPGGRSYHVFSSETFLKPRLFTSFCDLVGGILPRLC